MTKFNKFKTGPLTEVITKQDWDYFNAAYGIGIKDPTSAAAKAKKGRARNWLMSVFEVFAMKMDLDTAQAKHLFEQGDCTAVKAIYRRRIPGLREQMRAFVKLNATSSLPAQQLEERIKMHVKLSEMDNQDIINAVRSEWTRALSLPHPMFERHLVSGKSQVQKDSKSEAKVQGKRGSTPIVEHKAA